MLTIYSQRGNTETKIQSIHGRCPCFFPKTIRIDYSAPKMVRDYEMRDSIAEIAEMDAEKGGIDDP
jgi:hypothetical protein